MTVGTDSCAKSFLVVRDDPGDPITAVYLDDTCVVAGTSFGKIWMYDIKENVTKLVAGFSDDGIRGIYIQDSTLYAVVGDTYCRHIRVGDLHDQIEVRFDRRSSSSGYRYVFQKFSQLTIVYPGMTTFIDVVSNDQSMCPYRLQGTPPSLNVLPLDAYHFHLLVSEFTETGRKLRVVNVTNGQTVCDLDPKMARFVKLIDKKLLVYCDKRRDIVVYQYTKREEVLRKHFSNSEVLAMDSVFHLRLGDQYPPDEENQVNTSSSICPSGSLMTVVYRNGEVVCFNFLTGEIHSSGRLAKFCFSLGFPYLVSSNWRAGQVEVVVSSDYGAHFLRLVSRGV